MNILLTVCFVSIHQVQLTMQGFSGDAHRFMTMIAGLKYYYHQYYYHQYYYHQYYYLFHVLIQSTRTMYNEGNVWARID